MTSLQARANNATALEADFWQADVVMAVAMFAWDDVALGQHIS